MRSFLRKTNNPNEIGAIIELLKFGNGAIFLFTVFFTRGYIVATLVIINFVVYSNYNGLLHFVFYLSLVAILF